HKLVYEQLDLSRPPGMIAFSPDGTCLALGMIGDGTVQIWDLVHHKLVASWEGNPGGAIYTAVAFSPDGKTLVTGGSGGKIKLWNLAKSENSGAATPAKPKEQSLKRFDLKDVPLDAALVKADDGAWRIEMPAKEA